MARKIVLFQYKRKKPKKRPGVHAKSKTSRGKKSKLYRKRYRSQGRNS